MHVVIAISSSDFYIFKVYSSFTANIFMSLGGLDLGGLFMALVARIDVIIVNIAGYLGILNMPRVAFLANMAEALVVIF